MGGKHVICLIGSAKNRFAKMCFPQQREAYFRKNVSRKVSWSSKNMKKIVQRLGCLMQTGIDGYEIYKNVGVMHAVVFADRAQEAKSAHVMGRLQNFHGLKKRKNSDRNGQKSEKSKYICKKCSF